MLKCSQLSCFGFGRNLGGSTVFICLKAQIFPGSDRILVILLLIHSSDIDRDGERFHSSLIYAQ